MNILFVHQNMPGQYKHIARVMAAEPGNRVAFVTKATREPPPGVEVERYAPSRQANPQTHHYLRNLEDQVLYGQAAGRACMALKDKGFTPDIICAHSGWGEALYLKDIFPNAKLLVYCEFFYRSRGSDVYFEPGSKYDMDLDCRIRTKNAHMLLTMESMDWGMTPTKWQWQQHPDFLRDRISVIHDGIDTETCRPKPEETLTLPTGKILSREDEVVTYLARNLEPYRGFHVFMRALATLCRKRPNAEFVIIGGDKTSYGKAPRSGLPWREELLRSTEIDPRRVHFIGYQTYENYLKLLQISSAHIYLTYPFVLSWSMLESLSCGVSLVASNTPPVQEVLVDGENALLFDFHDADALAEQVQRLLEDRELARKISLAGRQTILDKYDLERYCLPRQLDLIRELAAGGQPKAA